MKKDNNNLYPKGYDHVSKNVKTAQERIQQLDEQIKNVPQNSKPQPVPRPPGFTQPRYFDRERAIANIEQQKNDLKTGTFDQIEQEVRETDPKIARQVRDQAREELFPNPFRKMDVKERNKYHEKSRDIDQSQNYMDAMFYSQKDSPKQEEETKEEKIATLTPSTQGSKYSLTLNFNGISDTSSTKKRERDIDRD